MRSLVLLSTLVIGSFFVSSCSKDDKDKTPKSNASSTLRVLKSPTGQHQTITADISGSGELNFNPQTLLADGGSLLHNYTWSILGGTGAPVGVTIEPLTGVINHVSKSSVGLSEGTT